MWLSIAIVILAIFIFFYDMFRIFKEKQVEHESISFLFAPVFLLSSYHLVEQGETTNYLAVISLAMLLTLGHILIVTINWWYFATKLNSIGRFRFFSVLGSINLLLLQIYAAFRNEFQSIIN